jgi:peptidyl-prolyl cis-trans isomerase SurA
VSYLKANQSVSELSPTAYVDQLYNYFVDETITLLEEEKLKIEKPEYKNLLTEYSEGILFFEIMEKEIWNKASEDTLGQRNYYEKNASKYQGGNRVRARIFSTPTKSIVEDFKHKINHGDTLRDVDLKKFKSVQPFRNYEKGDSKIIDKVNWVTGLQEVELDKNYYLIEISQLVAPGSKSFEEARAGIISDFQNELEQKWLNELRKKYPVVIDNNGKKFVLSELLKK